MNWRPLWVFVFSLLSVVTALYVLLSLFDWGMAEFDCEAGYLACRQNWIRNEGPWTAAVVLAWTAAAIWLYRTREKK